MNTILILEDLEERIRAFRAAVATIPDVEIIFWRNLIRDLLDRLASASLISLDCDLLPARESGDDPGSGLNVCEFLARRRPSCPVLLHTSNYIKVWSMMNELAFAKWDRTSHATGRNGRTGLKQFGCPASEK